MRGYKEGLIALGLLVSFGISYADDTDILTMDESQLFADTETTVTDQRFLSTNKGGSDNGKSVEFSGSILLKNTYAMTTNWLTGKSDGLDNRLTTYAQASFNLRVQLPMDISSYMDLTAYYAPIGQALPHLFYNAAATTNYTVYETNQLILQLKEFLVKANIANQVYFVIGKQNLQWGKGYFWTPTDLINVEKKNFLDMTRTREGVYGMKMTYSYKTFFNALAFLDAGNAKNPLDMAIAGKLEINPDPVSIAISGWAKRNYLPVFGLEFSGSFFEWDVRAEASLSYGENKYHLGAPVIKVMGPITITNYPKVQNTNAWITRICLGISKSIDWETDNRITFNGEFFYNQTGATNNDIFENKMKALSYVMNGMYEANYYGQFYGLLSVSMNRFILEDMTASVSMIGNISDMSFITFGSLSYTPAFNFTVGMNIYGMFGEKFGEYTASPSGLAADLTMTLNF